MIAYGLHKQQLQKLLDDDSTETAEEIQLFTNIAYRRIASMHFWQPLMTENTFTSLTLPGDLEKLYYVEFSDTDYLVFPISRTQRYVSRFLYNAFRNLTTVSPLSYGSDGVISANGTTFTSASPSVDFNATTTALAGQYIRIGTNSGIYKIASVTDANTIELEKGFRGDAETAAYYEIQPNGTQKVNLTDHQGTELGFTNWKYIYQRIPLPVYNDSDQIELPGTCEAVTIMTHQMMLLGDKYDNDALRRDPAFNEAIDAMYPLNPIESDRRMPRDRHGSLIMYGRRRAVHNYNADDRRVIGI